MNPRHFESLLQELIDENPFAIRAALRILNVEYVTDIPTLAVTCETKPTKVLLWQATNPEGRDFRMEKIGKVYTSAPVTESAPGVYRADIKAPEKGWTAFFLEMEFPNPASKLPFKFTTGVSIVPDVYPFTPPPGTVIAK